MSLIIRSSRIHNRGCYTTRALREGAKVVEYTGRRITVEEGDRLYDGKRVTYLFGLRDAKHVIDGTGIARYINHSCDPNCTTEEIDGHIWVIAIRDIQPGEELSYDYMLYDGDGDAPCRCGAKKCRGTMYAPQEIRRQKRAAERAKRKAGKTANKTRKRKVKKS
ncbi:MAG: SET domain-containing protein [Terriglobales bacterium]